MRYKRAVLASGRRIVDAMRATGPRRTATLLLDRVTPGAVRRRHAPTVVSAQALSTQLETILGAWGMSEEHASITTEHLLYADLRGIDSHGCSMLAHYQRALRDGLLDMNPSIEVVRESNSTALVDGGGGLGQVAGHRAMALAIEKCRSTGIGAVGVRNSGHFGAAGAYAAMASDAGYLGFVTSSADLPAIVPTGATEARLGTNPIAFAAPAEHNRPFLLDMATSTASLGKVFTAWRSGRSIPSGWALDETGAPVTNARRAFDHRLLTPLGASRELGSHKGYGLAAMAETLSSILTGMPAWREAPYRQRPVGHFFLAIDPGRFRGDDTFGRDLDLMLDTLRATRAVDPDTPVLVAGDPEHAALAAREQSGIPLARSIVADLRALATKARVPFVLDASP